MKNSIKGLSIHSVGISAHNDPHCRYVFMPNVDYKYQETVFVLLNSNMFWTNLTNIIYIHVNIEEFK